MAQCTMSMAGTRTASFQVQRKPCGAHRQAGRARSTVVCSASTTRRDFMQQAAVLAAGSAVMSVSLPQAPASAADLSTFATASPLCSEDCLAALKSATPVTTSTGLAYQEIQEGDGPSPPVGYQVVVNYVAMTPEGKVFANSLESKPYDIRVGAGAVIAGLDEGLLTMKSGGIRRLYIPGELAFPKGLASAPGRPRVPPNTPVVFDVQLLYVPGLE